MRKLAIVFLVTTLAVTLTQGAAHAWSEKSGKAGFGSRYTQLSTYYSPKFGTFGKLSSMSRSKLRAAGYWSLTLECDQKNEELSAYIMRFDKSLRASFMSPSENSFVDFELDGVEGYLSGYNATNYKAVYLANYFYSGDFESPYLNAEPAPEDDFFDPDFAQYGTFYDWERSKIIQFEIYLGSGSVQYPKFNLAKLSSQKKKLVALGCGAYFDRYF
jgi:hypothetical protein